VFLGERADFLEKRHHGAAAIARQFAPDQVKCLNTIGALVNHGDPRISHELLHPLLGDIAVPAIDLLCLYRVGKPGLGQKTLHDRCHKAHVIVRFLSVLRITGTMGDVALQSSPHYHGPRGLVERADR